MCTHITNYCQECFKFVQSCGNAVIPSYIPLVHKNKNKGTAEFYSELKEIKVTE
jgi:coproporphyrinogen III oxidase